MRSYLILRQDLYLIISMSGISHFKDLKIQNFTKDCIMGKYYFHSSTLSNLQILSSWIKMEGFKSILKYVSPSHNIIPKNGIQPGLLELCSKQSSVSLLKMFRELAHFHLQLMLGHFLLKRVIHKSVINVVLLKIYWLQENLRQQK